MSSESLGSEELSESHSSEEVLGSDEDDSEEALGTDEDDSEGDSEEDVGSDEDDSEGDSEEDVGTDEDDSEEDDSDEEDSDEEDSDEETKKSKTKGKKAPVKGKKTSAKPTTKSKVKKTSSSEDEIVVKETLVSPVQYHYPGQAKGDHEMFTKCLAIVTDKYPDEQQPESLAMCAINAIKFGSGWSATLQEKIDAIISHYNK
jgi:hypothetical protein